MSIEGLIVSLVIVAVFALWVAAPFWGSDSRRLTETATIERQRERLQVYYERVLRNLHDIDEDFATGKLNEQEHTIEREKWVQRGVQALKAMDTLDTQHLVAPITADDAAIDEAIDRTIEAAVSSFRDKATST